MSINGVQLSIRSIDTDGEFQDLINVVLALHGADGFSGGRPVVEITGPDDTIYSIDLEAFERALIYAKAEYAATEGESASDNDDD